MHHRRFQLVTTMRQDAQKQAGKFCTRKTAKNAKTHPEKPEKGETGCVLGAGGDENGCEQGRTDVKTQSPNQREPHSHATHEKGKRAKTQCFRPFCGRGRRTCLGYRLGRLVACVPPARTRPTTRTARGAAVPRCQDVPPSDKKQRHCKSSSAVFVFSFQK